MISVLLFASIMHDQCLWACVAHDACLTVQRCKPDQCLITCRRRGWGVGEEGDAGRIRVSDV